MESAFIVAQVAAELAVAEASRRVLPERKDSAEVVDVTNDARFVGGSLATIHIDGDPADVNVTVPVTFAGTLVPGDRVVVEYDAPRGAVVSGKASSGANVVPSGSLESSASTTVPSLTETVILFNETNHVCGGVEVVTGVSDSWLSVPIRGIYSVSANGEYVDLPGYAPCTSTAWIVRYTSADTEVERVTVDVDLFADVGATHTAVRVSFAANDGDRFRLIVEQDSGYDAEFGMGSTNAHLSVHWVTGYPLTAVPEPDTLPCVCPSNLVGTFTPTGTTTFDIIRGFAVSLDGSILYTLESQGGFSIDAIFRYTLPGLTPMDGAGVPWKLQTTVDPGFLWQHLTADASGNLSIISNDFPATVNRLLRITEAGVFSVLLTEGNLGWSYGGGSYPPRHAWSPVLGEFVASGEGPGASTDKFWRIPNDGSASTVVYQSPAAPDTMETRGAPVVTSDGVWVIGSGYNANTDDNELASSELAAPIPKAEGDAGTAIELWGPAGGNLRGGVFDAWYCDDGTIRYLRSDFGIDSGQFIAKAYDPNTNTETDLSATCDLSGLIGQPPATLPTYFVFQRGGAVWVLHRDNGFFVCPHTLLST